MRPFCRAGQPLPRSGPDDAPDTHTTPRTARAQPKPNTRCPASPSSHQDLHVPPRRAQRNTSRAGGSSACRLLASCPGCFLGGCEQTVNSRADPGSGFYPTSQRCAEKTPLHQNTRISDKRGGQTSLRLKTHTQERHSRFTCLHLFTVETLLCVRC